MSLRGQHLAELWPLQSLESNDILLMLCQSLVEKGGVLRALTSESCTGTSSGNDQEFSACSKACSVLIFVKQARPPLADSRPTVVLVRGVARLLPVPSCTNDIAQSYIGRSKDSCSFPKSLWPCFSAIYAPQRRNSTLGHSRVLPLSRNSTFVFPC